MPVDHDNINLFLFFSDSSQRPASRWVQHCFVGISGDNMVASYPNQVPVCPNHSGTDPFL